MSNSSGAKLLALVALLMLAFAGTSWAQC